MAFNFLSPEVTTPLGVFGSLNQEAGSTTEASSTSGNSAFKRLCQDARRIHACLETIGGLVVGHYLIKPGVIGIVFLHSIFVGDPEADEECAGQSDGETKEVEQGELTILEEVAPGQLEDNS